MLIEDLSPNYFLKLLSRHGVEQSANSRVANKLHSKRSDPSERVLI